MANRKVTEFRQASVKVMVSYNTEYSEYRSRAYVCGIAQEKADYFTDDKDDAIGTAKDMLIRTCASLPQLETM